MKQKIIFDTDNTFGVAGRPIDDGQAILYALGREDLEIVGITTTYGNSDLERVHSATQWLIKHTAQPDIPIHKGCARPKQGPTAASDFLVESVKKSPGEITIIAIGTMGNLLAAAESDPDFYDNVRQIYCMGGYQYRLPVRGWNKIPELNLSRDPEASYSVLYASCPVTLFDAHICLQAPFGLQELRPWAEFDLRSYYLQLDYLLANIKELSQPEDYLWDLLPVVCLSYPELFNQRKIALTSTKEDLKTGTIKFTYPEITKNKETHSINAPDYITDIDEFYKVMYTGWEKSPLVF